MNSIFITDEAGNLVDLSKLFDRVSKLESRLPLFDIPKSKRKKKSEREKQIRRQLINSYR